MQETRSDPESSNSSSARDPDRDTLPDGSVAHPLHPSRAHLQRMMRSKAFLGLVLVCLAVPLAASNVVVRRLSEPTAPTAATIRPPQMVSDVVQARLRADVAAMRAFRPGYPFWRHVFTIPDGSIAFGSAADGRLLATFPARGDWSRQAAWTDPAIAFSLDGRSLARKLDERREQVAVLMESAAGPVLHNSTRGDALNMNTPSTASCSPSGAPFTSGSACPRRLAWPRSSSNRA